MYSRWISLISRVTVFVPLGPFSGGPMERLKTNIKGLLFLYLETHRTDASWHARPLSPAILPMRDHILDICTCTFFKAHGLGDRTSSGYYLPFQCSVVTQVVIGSPELQPADLAHLRSKSNTSNTLVLEQKYRQMARSSL